MEFNYRKTREFVNISVDELKTTIFYSDKNELDNFITELLKLADSLSDETDRDLKDRLNDLWD